MQTDVCLRGSGIAAGVLGLFDMYAALRLKARRETRRFGPAATGRRLVIGRGRYLRHRFRVVIAEDLACPSRISLLISIFVWLHFDNFDFPRTIYSNVGQTPEYARAVDVFLT